MHAKIVVDNNFGVFGTLPGRLLLTQRIRVVDPPTASD
jgi:hypothetical protein